MQTSKGTAFNTSQAVLYGHPDRRGVPAAAAQALLRRAGSGADDDQWLLVAVDMRRTASQGVVLERLSVAACNIITAIAGGASDGTHRHLSGLQARVPVPVRGAARGPELLAA